MQSSTQSLKQPLGVNADWRRRLSFHHVPLIIVSVASLVLFMTLSSFDSNEYPAADIFSSTLPKEFAGGTAEHETLTGGGPESMEPGGGQAPLQQGSEQRSSTQPRKPVAPQNATF
jgi:hypothetical protein